MCVCESESESVKCTLGEHGLHNTTQEGGIVLVFILWLVWARLIDFL
jgi:hypothetical protein